MQTIANITKYRFWKNQEKLKKKPLNKYFGDISSLFSWIIPIKFILPWVILPLKILHDTYTPKFIFSFSHTFISRPTG